MALVFLVPLPLREFLLSSNCLEVGVLVCNRWAVQRFKVEGRALCAGCCL
jgi:hypothetical protein